jgi:hypothetical protein
MGFWEEYATETVKAFREEFNTFSGGEREYVKEHLLGETLLKPTQMEIFELKVQKGTVLFALHKTTLADMSVNLHTEATTDDIRLFLEKEGDSFKLTSEAVTRLLGLKTMPWLLAILGRWLYVDHENKRDPRLLARTILSSLRTDIKSAQVRTIEKTTEELKKRIPRIPEEDREELLAYATKIDAALQEIARIDAKVSDEIGGVRKIIGASKEFQDFRVFTTDVEDLKKTHVPKDVFVSEIKRLDEKIDSGLQALNTRMDDLKAIRFWSKRTLLEIALAILAALATLYAAGVLKF